MATLDNCPCFHFRVPGQILEDRIKEENVALGIQDLGMVSPHDREKGAKNRSQDGQCDEKFQDAVAPR